MPNSNIFAHYKFLEILLISVLIYKNHRYRFTQIAVDPQIKTPGGRTYDVIFVGTGESTRKKKSFHIAESKTKTSSRTREKKYSQKAIAIA